MFLKVQLFSEYLRQKTRKPYKKASMKRIMNKIDYERLLSDSFFVRDGKNRDSAGVLNTTNTFIEKD